MNLPDHHESRERLQHRRQPFGRDPQFAQSPTLCGPKSDAHGSALHSAACNAPRHQRNSGWESMNDDSEDFFSDDATFDALAEDELRAIEEEAVKSTQQFHQLPQYALSHSVSAMTPFKPPRPMPAPRINAYRPGFVSYTQQRQQQQALGKMVLARGNGQQQQLRSEYNEEEPTLPSGAPTTNLSQQLTPQPAAEPSSDYGDIDGLEDGVELWEATQAAQAAQAQAQNYSVVSGATDVYRQAAVAQEWNEQQAELGQIAEDVVMANSFEAALQNDQEAGVDGHRLQAEAFKAQVALLEQQLEQARQQMQAKAGEVAIVRNKLDQVGRKHERDLASVTTAHAEEEQKRIAELEAVKADRDRLLTEKAFQQREMDELVRKERANRRLQAPKTQDAVMSGSVEVDVSKSRTLTPKKKSKAYMHRDGFDDDDDVAMSVHSPPRLPSRSRTPTNKGLKRKRSVNSSPLLQLPLSHPRTSSIERFPVIDDKVLEKLFAQDDRFEFFEAIMLHKYPPTQQRILDALTKHSFSSPPGMTLSSYFLHKLTALQSSAENKAFSVGVSKIILGIWSQCLAEKNHDALSLVVELFRFAILWTQGSHCFEVMDKALLVIQETVDINAVPLATKRDCVLKEGIPTLACLQILEELALGCMREAVWTKRFWKQIRVDFPIMCLHIAQPLQVMQRMASILCASVLPDSFGPITSINQRANEGFLLEAATKPLELAPRQYGNESKYSATQILELRQELLAFLGCVCSTEIGMLALAKHDRGVLRIALRITEELDVCYDWRPGERIRTEFISFAVKLLYGVITTHPEDANAKLATNHKHLVAMVRVAFSEGIAQEAGIDQEAIEDAFELLENMVTPNEAAVLDEMFTQ
ncbi:hypothetical protein FN846DRAFT_906948 [Sphaerosporella brunnea]|uniref:DNA repair protein Rad26 n=1 Tax=Sphaerosporella brunnea TaxID=1250544 RepID=A0A5J5EXL1_9PEZI|nr:hypothetical protein FN846DRAFT_906948 [Sphaerosporella brunnea]